ncbi:glycosyl hydrolase [Hyunsoonleella pacifica]|uniref:Glycoside hydrolase n=1 Tax=Hyunsoonleella pacifica TaxID=1080224 RepID=A0A4Q9FS13_9FLAO|nr:glycosyl hydrolase [Hyunsoonleella pacifica]TBN18743.1 hypothetical protein EYD46_01375 [Hyunsoonleella pacifica]GGD04348.1 hypothetical protein GCM10011368_02750 [Hyunsoonleella pacifica]
MRLLNLLKTTSVVFFILSLFLLSCDNKFTEKTPSQDLFRKFKNPPVEARPFVRWWWNGNKIKKEELDRQLESLKSVGFGGVEINPIALPLAFDKSEKSLVWMSDEWIDMVVHAAKKAKDLGMITDIIAGTGWPFGGEFLKDEETSQRMVTDNISYASEETITVDKDFLIGRYQKKYDKKRVQRHISKRTTYKLYNVSLIPKKCNSKAQITDLTNYFDTRGTLTYKIVQPGEFYLSYTLIQQNFRDVTLGAPGGAGPVMDHYKKEMTYTYLSRLKKISERSGIPLNQLIRAIFCDSIEVSGANWTDNFETTFFKAYGYKLDKWIPFIFYSTNGDYSRNTYSKTFSSQFKDELKRVRYDYNKLLVALFLENFTKTYKDFCEANGVLCRYQAYGTPFLMGMLDGYMIPDIPESNNWIYSAKMKDSIWQWNQSHGYMTWNMYAAAGGHLTNKSIVSSEVMTNTRGVFKTTLEEIKQHDDMNFITGINHSILHGYNYSPASEPFPGWIRYGAYFSEQNTWWKHLNLWVDYNARLSAVFQNSQAEKTIAILGPTSDIWGDNGLAREPFHLEPRYLYKLWEPISQLGHSCEYINQNVLKDADIENGKILYGNMSYRLLVLASLKSLGLEATSKIESYVTSGGKLIVIDELPIKSLHYTDYKTNDALVKQAMEQLVANYPKSIIQVKQPNSLDDLFSWTQNILQQSETKADIVISKPTKKVYQIHQSTKNKDIYFFTNVHKFDNVKFNATFPVEDKYPYVWNPETGERKPYYYKSKSNELSINLGPLESLLLVFENEKPLGNTNNVYKQIKNSKIINTNWEVTGNNINNKTYTWELEKLVDFGKSKDTTKNSFGGEIIYRTTIISNNQFSHLDLGKTNGGITTLYINGKKVGVNWYGKPVFLVKNYLKTGENHIEIHHTTVLANYCKSINNPLTTRWTRNYTDKVSIGVEGPVKLISY